ncbi:ATP-dependent DNA helicase DinG [Exilibacterium tricleocarpae]|uniref:ATP-dependent DNA helicase DinG n=1 Tax=Exilibacterium tricleocarpae TaxID=2591008 RepID=A0A545U5A3_9GAMM|nr:ATP-dependent DNA helicase DinG [Exilibacterium tricleocarpae]TQV84649.1 ATP-dependent DNA helicase DinG [Exilibacterium tricleocarpae]
MLTDDLKQTIQQAYSQFLDSRGLKPRLGQKLMIAEVAKTLGGLTLGDDGARLSDGHVCVVEAGTGTGKTVAYLIAALPIARALGKKLVISTATVALQEQIVNKDLPELREHSGLQFSFALAKGRGRYLCLSKLDRLLMEHESAQNPTRPLYEDELPQVGETSIKIYNTMVEALAANRWDGDRDNWPDAIDNEAWSRVTTDHRQCTGRRCSNVSSCSFFKSRDNLGAVDCVVTNHDLVLADLALGGGAILPAPADTIYIFDEGHHLPAKALNHFAHHSRLLATNKWLDQCNKALPSLSGQLSGAGNIDHYTEQLPAAIGAVKQRIELAFPLVETLMDAGGEAEPPQRYRFERGLVPSGLKALAQELAQCFDRLADLYGKITAELDEAIEDRHCGVPRADMENWYPVIGTWLARAEANRALWVSYATPDGDRGPPKARWVTLVDQTGPLDFEVCSSPILAANTLEQSLWRHCCSAVVTSATLTALGKFDRYQMRAGTPPDSVYQVVPSPFDYSKAVVRIPAAAVDAGDAAAHTRSLVTLLPEILDAKQGSLVLFASRRQMLDVYDGLAPAWQEKILLQGERSKQETLNAHRQRIDEGEGSVLFGLASFAEGLDLPGAYCRHVVMAKIPFAVPDDPVEAALSEWVESRGGNAFMEITVPDAALKMIQASGRLLRTEADTGTISLLDKRLLTRRYGKAILNSLPPFQRDFG